MAKWRAEATVVWYFDVPDKATAEKMFNLELDAIDSGGYRNAEIEEIDEKEWEREQ